MQYLRKFTVKSAVLVIVILIIAGGCYKFEEGPQVSLRSPEKKITDLWFFVRRVNFEDNIEQYAGFKGWSIEFKKDGVLEKKVRYLDENNQYRDMVIRGEWELIADNYLRIKENIGEWEDFNIIRLTGSEFWLYSHKQRLELSKKEY